MKPVGEFRSTRNFRPFLGLVGFLWLASLSFGIHKSMVWESTPGQSAKGAPTVAPGPGKISLVLVVHSLCPCSSATLQNLLALRPEELNSIDKTIVITGPGANWDSNAKNVGLAKQIPGARLVFCSEEGAEKKYHSFTSGQAFVLDPNGKVLYSGGLTDSRGLCGESIGIQSLQAALRGERCVRSAPVFGCALNTPRGTN